MQPPRLMFHMRVMNWVSAKLFALIWNKKFGSFGKNVRIIAPVAIEGASGIFIGENTLIAYKSCLAVNQAGPEIPARLEIGSGCQIGRFNHIYCTREISIGDKVLTANNVYISDNIHQYANIHIPVLEQGIMQKDKVVIGDGTWIGHNAVIIGATVGKNCVIGANCVVTKDIPDFCVVVGMPGQIIKRFCTSRAAWFATNPDGSFKN